MCWPDENCCISNDVAESSWVDVVSSDSMNHERLSSTYDLTLLYAVLPN
jgi:hypothetical protein